MAAVKVKGGGTLALVGLLTVLVGAWAGIVPYIGPTFGFGATGTPAWTWSLLHTLLWLAPGAVAVLCGLLIMAHVPSLRNGRGGRGAGLGRLPHFPVRRLAGDRPARVARDEERQRCSRPGRRGVSSSRGSATRTVRL